MNKSTIRCLGNSHQWSILDLQYYSNINLENARSKANELLHIRKSKVNVPGIRSSQNRPKAIKTQSNLIDLVLT